MSRTASRTLAAVLNLSLVGSLACAGTRSPDDIAPTIRVGMYDLEVPTLAMEAFLVVNEPTEAYVRDTLWVHHGDVFECSPLLRVAAAAIVADSPCGLLTRVSWQRIATASPVKRG